MTKKTTKARSQSDLEMKILVVDDEPSIVQLLNLALRALGFKNVETAYSASQALEIVENSDDPIDCFLIDIQMPAMDGMELCKVLRKKPTYKRTPILMLTAMSERDYVEQSFAAGANDYIMKPFEIEDLITRVDTAARLHREIVSASRIMQLDGKSHNLQFEDALSFDGVPGFLEQITFKNYIDRMERSQFRHGGIVAVKVVGANDLFVGPPIKSFIGLLAEMSDIISVAMRNERCHFTYAGSGCFLVLKLAVEKPGFHRDVGEMVNEELSRVGLKYPKSDPKDIRVSVGRLFRDAAGEFDSIDATLMRARDRIQVDKHQ